MNSEVIYFNKPFMTGKELHYISEAHYNNKLAGDGPFTKKCQEWICEKTGTYEVLLTHSCTAALEIAAMLIDTQPNDEIIMPSFTFVSTANAFVLRGGTPVFIDIRKDTLNLDENLIEAAITSRTKAIVPVHYAGVGCEMDTIMEIAERHNLRVIEDAAQGVMSSYKDRSLGAIGDLGAYSFHETKNLISGEGGALLINDEKLVQQAEIIREKGTDRSRYFRGNVDKYTWQDKGSSYLPGEIIAAFLWAQLEEAESITRKRISSWNIYHQLIEPLEEFGLLQRPFLPEDCKHNAHMYYIILGKGISRDKVIFNMGLQNIYPVFHYVPLHSSPAGKRYCKNHGELTVTEEVANRLLRLPLWIGLKENQQCRVVDTLKKAILGLI